MVRVVLSVVIQNGLNGEVAHVKGKIHLRIGHEGSEERRSISLALFLLNLGTRQQRMVNAMPQLHYA